MNTKMTPEELVDQLELAPPNIYARVMATVPQKKGGTILKKCVLNLSTGDVYAKRKIAASEVSNFRMIRHYKNYQDPVDQDIIHYAYQSAQMHECGIVLTTWCFADHVNYPGTAEVTFSWNAPDVSDAIRGEKVDEEATFNIKLSPPRIAAMVLVTPDKEVYAWQDIELYGYMVKHSKAHIREDAYLAQALLTALFKAYDTKRIPNLTTCFKEQFEIGYLGANKYVVFDSYKDVSPFMRSKPLAIPENEHQKQVDSLTAVALPDHTFSTSAEKTICYADRVNEEWVVLRWYMQSRPGRFLEISRMYVNKTQAIQCRSDLRGKWAYSHAKLKAETFKADRVVMQTPEVFDGTKLEYFKHISTEMANQSAALYMLTMYPEFEKMYKADLDWLCQEYLKSPYSTSWKNFMEMHCGDIDWKAKNIHKMIGINSHQSKSINQWRDSLSKTKLQYWEEYYARSIIRTMKNIFCDAAINSIDNATFDYILNTINCTRLSGSYTGALARVYDMYRADAIYFIKDLNAISDGTQTLERNDNVPRYMRRHYMTLDTLFGDVFRMIQSGNYMDVLRPRFSTQEELEHIHTVMTDLINADQLAHEARQNAQHEANFTSHKSRWDKWAWEGDEKFCVIAPSKPVDIAEEGMTLHHCVRSYIPSVSNGDTNIMFIRVKGKENTPFFTVEVDKHNAIRQVHGMCNSNVDSVSGLTEFVAKWAKMKKLKYSQAYANGLRVPVNQY